MKIKKMYQGTVPENKILNTYSTSQTDTYACDYINKIGQEVNFNNEWLYATKVPGAGASMLMLPFINPQKETLTFNYTNFEYFDTGTGWHNVTDAYIYNAFETFVIIWITGINTNTEISLIRITGKISI